MVQDCVPSRRQSVAEFFQSQQERRRKVFQKQWPSIRHCYREGVEVEVPRNPRKCASEGALLLMHERVAGFPDEGSTKALLDKDSPYLFQCQREASKRYLQKKFEDKFDQAVYESLGGHKFDTCYGSRHPCDMHKMQIQLLEMEVESEGKKSKNPMDGYILDEFGLPKNRRKSVSTLATKTVGVSQTNREHLKDCNLSLSANGKLINRLGCTCGSIKAAKQLEVNEQLDKFIKGLLFSTGMRTSFLDSKPNSSKSNWHLEKQSKRRYTAEVAVTSTTDTWRSNDDACWHQVKRHYFDPKEIIVDE